MQIIEFNGLPGTGKTTIAKELKRRLESCGNTCISSYDMGSFLRFCILCLRNPSCLLLLLKLQALNKAIDSDNKNWRSALLILHYYNAYLLCGKSKAEFFIVDQGILQGIISMVHTNAIPDGRLLRPIASIILKRTSFWRIDCMINENVSFERIRSRVPAGSRLEGFNDDGLRSTFRVQSNNFRLVRESFSAIDSHKSIEIDTTNSVELNINTILSNIIK